MSSDEKLAEIERVLGILVPSCKHKYVKISPFAAGCLFCTSVIVAFNAEALKRLNKVVAESEVSK